MKIVVDPKRCRASRECVKACPEKAISIVGGIAQIDPKKCDLDGICIAACPHQAIHLEEDD